jgi:hypothetical protein
MKNKTYRLDDTIMHKSFFSEVCSYCKHLYIKKINLKKLYGGYCKAFPNGDGIPKEIWEGKNDHRKLFPGDNGIIFEKRI